MSKVARTQLIKIEQSELILRKNSYNQDNQIGGKFI